MTLHVKAILRRIARTAACAAIAAGVLAGCASEQRDAASDEPPMTKDQAAAQDALQQSFQRDLYRYSTRDLPR